MSSLLFCSHHLQNEFAEVERGESDPMAPLTKILRGVMKVENKNERRLRLTEVFKDLSKGETLRKTARNFSNVIRALKGIFILFSSFISL